MESYSSKDIETRLGEEGEVCVCVCVCVCVGGGGGGGGGGGAMLLHVN